MRYTLLLCLVLAANFCRAQNDSGILFENQLSWTEIKQKAQKEHKFIFIDCYATWCAPCKAMDKDVYTKADVGQFMNTNFISVKLQFDQTKDDDLRTKQWRQVADEIMINYHINAFPSYLFYTADGKIVHRSLGYLDPKQFIGSAQLAMDPVKQYYTLLEKYNKGERNSEAIIKLAQKANNIGDTLTAYRIAYDYIKNHLLQLPSDQLYTAANIQFINSFTPNTHAPGFDLFLSHGDQVDKLTYEYWSRDQVKWLIGKEYVKPFLLDGKKIVETEPDWMKIGAVINKHFGKYWSDLVILESKLIYYGGNNQWTKYCAGVIDFVDRYGPFGLSASDVRWKYNTVAGLIYTHSDNRKQLEKALTWSKKSLREEASGPPSVQSMDTYACLLYKLGKVKEAIALEQKAIQYVDSVAVAKGGRQDPLHDIYIKVVEKMKNGQPVIW